MGYQRTQLYLEPEVLRRLTGEAAARGISLTALVREIVDRHFAKTSAIAPHRSFEAIFDLGRSGRRGETTDVAGDLDEYVGRAVEAEHLEKTSRRTGARPDARRAGSSSAKKKRVG